MLKLILAWTWLQNCPIIIYECGIIHSHFVCLAYIIFQQIIHTRKSHWATLQIVGSNIYIYDSAYASACSSTLAIIAQLVHSKDRSIQVQLMNVAKQAGASDCGLYALATMTSLAVGVDPITVIFNNEELRPHFAKVLETGTITAFSCNEASKTSGPCDKSGELLNLLLLQVTRHW